MTVLCNPSPEKDECMHDQVCLSLYLLYLSSVYKHVPTSDCAYDISLRAYFIENPWRLDSKCTHTAEANMTFLHQFSPRLWYCFHVMHNSKTFPQEHPRTRYIMTIAHMLEQPRMSCRWITPHHRSSPRCHFTSCTAYIWHGQTFHNAYIGKGRWPRDHSRPLLLTSIALHT